MNKFGLLKVAVVDFGCERERRRGGLDISI